MILLLFTTVLLVISNHSNHSGYVVCGNDLARLVFEHVLG
jgi:hypothetical protein